MQKATEFVSSKSQAPNLKRGLAILEYLAKEPEGGTVTQLSDQLNYPTASVFRIVKVLDELGYLFREPRSKKYFLTNRFLLMGQPQGELKSLNECAIEAMHYIRRKTGETTQLCCLVEKEMVVIEQLVSTFPFKYSADLGARCPCYSNAPGKAIIAFMSGSDQKILIDSLRFKKYTETTITSKKVFYTELEKIRETGFSLDRAEGMVGVHCVAAPIFDRHGVAVAAITIAGPSSRIPENKMNEIGLIVCEGTARATREFCQQ
jgi:DNA-binding IclR family transcriptional regulator